MADMTAIARPYAKAVFEFALEHKQFDFWTALLEQMSQILIDPLCVAFISNPSTTPQQHGELMHAMLHSFKLAQADDHAQQFVALLAHNKRLLAVPSIYQVFLSLRANYEKTLTVDVVSFSALSKEQIAQLTMRLNKRLQREVSLQLSVDPAILGGAIIRAGHRVFDGSVRTQIKNLSNTLAA